jgi:quaternary ammonium compound-resistance protein SugE
MPWLYLLIAGLFEVVWALSMKFNHGFTRLWPSAATLLCALGSLVFFSTALKSIPIGTGYAVWTGIGAAGTALLGMVFFGESRDLIRLLCVALIVAGVIGLKVATGQTN